MTGRRPAPALGFHPLTPERWPDLERLFGPRGAYGGCWCMWWRSTRAEFTQRHGEGNRRALRAIVEAGETPGVLAYADGEPVGWVAVAPREAYASLERSRTLRRIDATPVWSITCFYVANGSRRRGLMARLLEAAVQFAASRGARVVEGYPLESDGAEKAPVTTYMGVASAFQASGFVEAGRGGRNRPIMRRYLDGGPTTSRS